MSDEGVIVESGGLSSGWSITVADLRKALENVPDDYEVMITNTQEIDDLSIAGVHIADLMPPSAEGSPGLLVLGGGQIVNSEYGYDARQIAELVFDETKG